MPRTCKACEARQQTIELITEQLRLANMRVADLEQRARRSAPREYEELTPLHEIPSGQIANGLRRIYSEEGTEFIEVYEGPDEAEAPTDEEVPA